MNRSPKPKIVVLGSLCRSPVAGIAWQGIHYLLGFERLGLEAYYVECHGNWVPDPTRRLAALGSPAVVVSDVLQQYGFGSRWHCESVDKSCRHYYGGLAADSLPGLYRDAEAIINLSGAHVLSEQQLACRRRVYLETDPGIPQIRLSRGEPTIRRLVDEHTHHFTWAENIDGADCRLPPTNLLYSKSRQPVVLDCWTQPGSGTAGDRFTTIARWRKEKEKTIEFGGHTYHWDKDREFMKYADLPGRSRERFELALSQVSEGDRAVLESAGWTVVDALPISAELDSYRAYIQDSRGEFTIAKEQYAGLRTGWIGDRTPCYLAAGRPVIAQDTGYSNVLPTGEGLFAFNCLDEVLAAIEAISSDYDRHATAAAELSREFFDSDRVLGTLLTEIGVEHSVSGRA
jgi:hypothetical protein